MTDEQPQSPPPAGEPGDTQAERTPASGRIHQISFLPAVLPPGELLVDLSAGRPLFAVQFPLTAVDSVAAGTAPPVDLQLFSLIADAEPTVDLLPAARDWVDGGDAVAREQSLLLTLHGAQVAWFPGRLAVIAPRDRQKAVTQVAVEFAWLDLQLRDVERRIAGSWAGLEEDSPSVFNFGRRDLRRREELGRRYQSALSQRARLSQLSPRVHRPVQHPPTLASQVADRLRERARLIERWELFSDQLEVFEDVYEQCAQRSHDFALASRGHTLELVIIILLLFQTVMVMIEMLSAAQGT